MSKWYCGFFMAMGCLLQTSCAPPPPPISTAEAVAKLRTGAPLLACREACLGAWRAAQPQAAQLAASGRWPDLVALVERINYQDDLSLYYLGQAAEGLGFPGAAASYFRQSTYLSGTTIACQNLSRMCGGLNLPQAALVQLAAIEQSLIRRRIRRPGPALREPGAPLSMPASEAEPSVPVEAAAPPAPEPPPSVPIAEPPPPPPPPAAPAPARPATTEFIEPPPAPR